MKAACRDAQQAAKTRGIPCGSNTMTQGSAMEVKMDKTLPRESIGPLFPRHPIGYGAT